jgi:translation initiation factor IF-2
MPEVKKTANVDDYYAHIPALKEEGDALKKSSLKLKIKAKKPTESESAEPAAPIAESASEAPKKPVIKKTASISFEPAPVVLPRPASSAPAPEVPKSDQRPAGGAMKPVSAPLSERLSGASYVSSPDRPKRPMTPRISFEQPKPFQPLSNRPVAPGEVARRAPAQGGQNHRPASSGSGTGGSRPAGANGAARPGADRLANYSAKHREDPRKKGESFRPGDRKGAPKTRGYMEDDGGFRRSGKTAASAKKEKKAEDVKQILVDRTGQEVEIPDILTVKEFSDKIGVPLPKVIGELMKNGMLVNINTKIDFDTCFLISEAFQVKVSRERNADVSASSLLEGDIVALLKNDDVEKMTERAPVISIMGHVDHGKTSILDYIRKTQVASGEAGGITQKIGAYQVERNGKKITFLDTPGHEAFSIMRSRGARLTDIAVIVIAADEGMKPQTIESINHAKEADVPMIIAVNKMDKPGANLDLIRGQLAEQGLQPEDWGGSTVVIPVSAHTGLGIETLLDMIVLSTDLMDLKAVADRPAVGTVIESHLDPRLGSLSTVLINAGTLRKGDYVVCANAYGRIRALKDFRGKNVDEAGVSVPVQVVGMSTVVEGGSILQAVADAETAAAKAHEYELLKSTKSVRNFESASLDMLMNRIKSGSLKQLKIVLKCESNGSLEALKHALAKLSTDETKVTFIHSGVGDINDSDVLMAGTSQALLVGYNVSVNHHARSTLANSKIEFIDKKVIYHVIEKVESIITGMVDVRYDDVDLGAGVVKAIFYTGKDKLIIGLGVKSGKVENRAKVRVVREDSKVGSGEVTNLKQGPLDMNEVEEGNDCGISFKGDVKIQEGDRLEFYKMVLRK